VDPRAGLENVERRKLLTLLGLEAVSTGINLNYKWIEQDKGATHFSIE
jgi:hypothetical protein